MLRTSNVISLTNNLLIIFWCCYMSMLTLAIKQVTEEVTVAQASLSVCLNCPAFIGDEDITWRGILRTMG